MIKVVQFGEGNFLRTFADAYFNALNKEEGEQFEVHIVTPIPCPILDKFVSQNYQYHIILRGMKNGQAVEDVYPIDVVKEVFSPFTERDKYYALAKDEDVKIIVSNTTEAGICFSISDKIDNFDHMSYPGKLTLFLFERFKAHLPGLYLLPVELIDHNADELYKAVNQYISLWNLPDEFRKWNDNENYYCSTLVDRIVSGYPRDEETRNHLTELIKQEDNLMSVGEPFGLWVIEDKGDISHILKDGHHNIDVIFAKDITYYKKRKVRVLNGSHTNLVPIALWKGKETVYDVMNDKELLEFVNATLKNDIIPFVSDDIAATTKFANDVIERFFNPFLNHQLTSIALNSISKWKARDLCSYVDYYAKNKSLPKYLTIGFAYLINMYMRIEKNADKYIVKLPSRTIEVKDDEKNLTYFLSGHTVHDFLKDVSLWDMDLTSFVGLEEKINEILNEIK